jgi:transcriptional regulator with XRE-family HTH domain
VTYGARLRELRAERQLSLREVEERGGPNKDTMSLIERDVHKPHPQTLGRIAKALGMDVSSLRFELESAARPLGGAPPSQQLTLNGELEEERRTAWESAAENARRLREDGQTRMAELLSTWRASKERGEAYATRRRYLDAIGALLQQAYDAAPALFEASSSEGLVDQWAEIQKAHVFYLDLWHLVRDEGLSIRTQGKETAAEHVQPEGRPYSIEEPEAA